MSDDVASQSPGEVLGKLDGIDRAELTTAYAEMHSVPLFPEASKTLSRFKIGRNRADTGKPGCQGSLAPARLPHDQQVALRPTDEPVVYGADDPFTADKAAGTRGYIGRYAGYERTVHQNASIRQSARDSVIASG